MPDVIMVGGLLWIVLGILLATAFHLLKPSDYDPRHYDATSHKAARRILAHNRREISKHRAGR